MNSYWVVVMKRSECGWCSRRARRERREAVEEEERGRRSGASMAALGAYTSWAVGDQETDWKRRSEKSGLSRSTARRIANEVRRRRAACAGGPRRRAWSRGGYIPRARRRHHRTRRPRHPLGKHVHLLPPACSPPTTTFFGLRHPLHRNLSPLMSVPQHCCPPHSRRMFWSDFGHNVSCQEPSHAQARPSSSLQRTRCAGKAHPTWLRQFCGGASNFARGSLSF